MFCLRLKIPEGGYIFFMTENEMKAMTVVQLRKAARELGITLGAGIDKAGIIIARQQSGVFAAKRRT